MKLIADQIKAILAITVIIGSFSYFYVTYFFGKGSSDPQIIIAIVGAMTTVLAYYFGNSQGASKKDDTIASMANNPVINNSEVTNVKNK